MRTAPLIVAAGLGVALLSTAASAGAQEARAAGPARPWPPQRLADGQPNVEGIWAAANGGSVSLTNPISGGEDLDRRVTGVEPRRPSRIIDPADGQVPYQPWAAARQKQQGFDYDHASRPEHIDPQHRCLLSGVPRLYTIVPAFKIIQPPGSVIFVWDDYHAYRVIPLDGRPHVAACGRELMGDARGRFEGDTLVVETTNFTNRMHFGYNNNYNSEKLRLVERFTPVAPGRLNWEVTVNDPEVWTRPWTFGMMLTKDDSQPVFEYACHEGNYGLLHILQGARAED
jgi:hypothetical protein